MRALAALLALGALAACAGTSGDPSPAASASQTPEPSPKPSPAPTASRPPSREPRLTSGVIAAHAGEVAGAVCGRGGRIVRFRIEIDGALARRITAAAFGTQVRDVLCDRRSWIASGEVRFRFDPQGPLLVGLRTPDEAERRCLRVVGLSVRRRYSCGAPREVVINSDRWFRGSEPWPGPLRGYRRMLTNHEIGHALGLHHESCPRDGDPAPVMMQQSKGMTSPNGRTCDPNPWPLSRELARLR